MISNDELPEIPCGSTRIWFAQISGNIIRIKYKKTIKDKFSIFDVYRDGVEHDTNSYFMRNIRHTIKLDKNEESFEITNIEKIKYIGFSLPNT